MAKFLRLFLRLKVALGSGLWPSGKKKKTTARMAREMAARRTNIQRQPKCRVTKPPTVGAKRGETLRMSMSREKTFALSLTWKKSRTMARSEEHTSELQS